MKTGLLFAVTVHTLLPRRSLTPDSVLSCSVKLKGNTYYLIYCEVNIKIWIQDNCSSFPSSNYEGNECALGESRDCFFWTQSYYFGNCDRSAACADIGVR